MTGVIYRNADGKEVTLQADQIISSMPIKDLVEAIAHEEPSTDKEMVKVAQGLPYRDFVTVGLLVRHLRIRNTTSIKTLGDPPIVPDCWIYVQDPGYKMGRIQIFNNWSPYMVKNVDGTVWIGLEYF